MFQITTPCTHPHPLHSMSCLLGDHRIGQFPDMHALLLRPPLVLASTIPRTRSCRIGQFPDMRALLSLSPSMKQQIWDQPADAADEATDAAAAAVPPNKPLSKRLPKNAVGEVVVASLDAAASRSRGQVWSTWDAAEVSTVESKQQ